MGALSDNQTVKTLGETDVMSAVFPCGFNCNGMAEAFWSRVGLFLFDIELQNYAIVSVLDIPLIANLESEAKSDNDLGHMK